MSKTQKIGNEIIKIVNTITDLADIGHRSSRSSRARCMSEFTISRVVQYICHCKNFAENSELIKTGTVDRELTIRHINRKIDRIIEENDFDIGIQYSVEPLDFMIAINSQNKPLDI